MFILQRQTPTQISIGFYVNYRPQRSWGKAMFLQASVILLTGGVPDQVHLPQDQVHPLPWDQVPPQTRYTPRPGTTPLGPGTPPQTRSPPGPGTPPGDQAHPHGTREIRSMRGRYASYWNAFLFIAIFVCLGLCLCVGQCEHTINVVKASPNLGKYASTKEQNSHVLAR